MRYSLLAIAIILAGCAGKQPQPVEIVKIEKPKPQIIVPPDPYQGLVPDVVTAIKQQQTPTLKEGIATFFPYTPNQAWDVTCQPLYPTEIRLNTDEWTDKDSVVIGDSVRWAVKISKQAMMVEPLGTSQDPHMQTSLVIHSSLRSYHLNLKLGRGKTYMAAIQWYYPDLVREQETEREAALKLWTAQQTAQATDTPTPPTAPQAQPTTVSNVTVVPQQVAKSGTVQE